MNYLVLGCGPNSMGEAIATRLLQEDSSRVYITDQIVENVDKTWARLKTQSQNLKWFLPGGKGLDVLKQKDSLPLFFKDFDIIISAVPAFLNPLIAEAVLVSNEIYAERKTHYCDLGGVLAAAKKILSPEFFERAKKCGISLVAEDGYQPGTGCAHMVDMYLKYFDEDSNIPLDSMINYVGGLPKKTGYYKHLFNLGGLAEIYFSPALVLSNCKVRKIQPLSHYEEFNSSKFGFCFGEPDGVMMEAAVTGGLGVLPYYMAGRIKTMQEKTLRFKGHYEFVKKHRKNFIESLKESFKKNPELKDDFCLMQIEAVGIGKETGKKIKVVRTMYVESDGRWNSMQKATGFTAAATAELIAEGKAKPGAYPPEIALDPAEIVSATAKYLPIVQEYVTPLE